VDLLNFFFLIFQFILTQKKKNKEIKERNKLKTIKNIKFFDFNFLIFDLIHLIIKNFQKNF
jgi:hypothetical protein